MSPASHETILSNARLVLPDRVVHGSLAVRDGRITDLNSGNASAPCALDLDGDLLLPGLVEMHTDNLEKQLQPRPGVAWPSPLAALLGHDAQIAAAGITTVLDSVFVGDYVEIPDTSGKPKATPSGRRALLARSLEAVHQGRDQDFLRADHHLHLRCELSDGQMPELFTALVDDPLLQLVSLMDHTPGQRQWTDLDKWRHYHRDKRWSDEQVRRILDYRREQQALHAGPGRELVTRLCRERAIPLASHDDTTPDHADESAASGVVISEFPTTLAAAESARELGMAVAMGAPNLVRGCSHSGNASAQELAERGLLDILSSDYAPISLLHAAFLLHERGQMDLPAAVATVTANPARALGFTDRGRLAPGLRADLVRVRLHDGLPVVRGVWREGRQVA